METSPRNSNFPLQPCCESPVRSVLERKHLQAAHVVQALRRDVSECRTAHKFKIVVPGEKLFDDAHVLLALDAARRIHQDTPRSHHVRRAAQEVGLQGDERGQVALPPSPAHVSPLGEHARAAARRVHEHLIEDISRERCIVAELPGVGRNARDHRSISLSLCRVPHGPQPRLHRVQGQNGPRAIHPGGSKQRLTTRSRAAVQNGVSHLGSKHRDHQARGLVLNLGVAALQHAALDDALQAAFHHDKLASQVRGRNCCRAELLNLLDPGPDVTQPHRKPRPAVVMIQQRDRVLRAVLSQPPHDEPRGMRVPDREQLGRLPPRHCPVGLWRRRDLTRVLCPDDGAQHPVGHLTTSFMHDEFGQIHVLVDGVGSEVELQKLVSSHIQQDSEGRVH
mmetsp:Transcript_10373/g.28282  ORF Transcript_10373/g.28282 Transcript_10373/m.28282 type:complete len:393 (-) Transcript_10373:523-1701(-)